MAGRPSKLTPEILKDITEYIKEGIPPATAAELSGISKRTHERWMKSGREAKRKNKYTEYCRKIEGAKSYAARQHLHRIIKSKDWKAQKYLLTLLYPDIYSDPDKIELSGKIEQDIKSEVEVSIHDRIKKTSEYFKQLDTK